MNKYIFNTSISKYKVNNVHERFSLIVRHDKTSFFKMLGKENLLTMSNKLRDHEKKKNNKKIIHSDIMLWWCKTQKVKKNPSVLKFCFVFALIDFLTCSLVNGFRDYFNNNPINSNNSSQVTTPRAPKSFFNLEKYFS